ncbi:unnamed protein product [Cyprideis torosa]|uniref:Uncharacterized protein n=1 Tax=Cyprideis torosa TaxID=163714 RepID=A0A7R8ZFY9_9CRUS|nr:unnamed protein product [Cyprideis torosa]CAG0880290.1 unnamed protein product [Cyprideis torosa]
MSEATLKPSSGSDMDTSKEGDAVYFAKLEAIKDLRAKMGSLERVRSCLVQEVERAETEERALGEFRQEMELLLQEKMAHVEELRQIHADINALETIMKQAEASRESAYQSARRFHEEYRPLKGQVDRLRSDILGLRKLPDLPDPEPLRINPQCLEKITGPSSVTSNAGLGMGPLSEWAHQQQVPASLHPSRSATIAHAPHHAPPHLFSAAHHSASAGPGSSLGHLARIKAETPTAPPFSRQQPPPMKSCLSCHQQIHRNAPICPLCKAKSRSRNPKKPKRKDNPPVPSAPPM